MIGERFTILYMDIEILEVFIESPLRAVITRLGENCLNIIPSWLYNADILTLNDVLEWVDTRLPDRTREDYPSILKRYGITEYIPAVMLGKSHGRSMTDHIWVRFADERLVYADVRIR